MDTQDSSSSAEAETVVPVEGFRMMEMGSLEFRDATPEEEESGFIGTLVGFLARFDEWAEIDSAVEGHFMERVAARAFSKTFQEGRERIRCIFHHGLDPSTGVRVLGPINVLEETAEGAWSEVSLLDTAYCRELLPGIRAGLYGMSFRFKAVRQNWYRQAKRSSWNPKGLAERTLTELAIPEFGPTPFPAYSGATAGLRSITDDYLLDRLMQDPEKLDRLTSRSRIFIPFDTPTGAVVQASTGGDTRASVTTTTTTAARQPSEVRVVRERLYERAVNFAVDHPWEMHPPALAVLLAVLQERASGEKPTKDEVMERLGIRAIDLLEEDDPQTSPVAVIPIYGPIIPKGDMFSNASGLTSVDAITAKFRAALEDPNVKAILFDVDSPGGSSAMVPELTAEIAAARGQKPMVAVANTLMASAAYHLMAQADEIVASPSADVGSIGAYSAHQDLTQAMEKLGKRVTIVNSEGSPFKTELSPFVELSEEAQADMQRRVDEVYNEFVDTVASGRDTSTQDVRENYGQGRVLSAKGALAVGMVDKIDTFDSTLRRMTDKYGATAPASRAATSKEPHPVVTDSAEGTKPKSTAARRGIDPVTLKPKEAPSWRL